MNQPAVSSLTGCPPQPADAPHRRPLRQQRQLHGAPGGCRTMGETSHAETVGKWWKTMGKPWENHGKTMGKPWKPWISTETWWGFQRLRKSHKILGFENFELFSNFDQSELSHVKIWYDMANYRVSANKYDYEFIVHGTRKEAIIM